jgi:hypothetical protein
MAPEDPNVKPAPQKTTLRGINKALRLAGREERLARGRGYFLFHRRQCLSMAGLCRIHSRSEHVHGRAMARPTDKTRNRMEGSMNNIETLGTKLMKKPRKRPEKCLKCLERLSVLGRWMRKKKEGRL